MLALAIEHTWAVSLANAMWNAGAEVALNWRIAAPIVNEALAGLTGADA